MVAGMVPPFGLGKRTSISVMPSDSFARPRRTSSGTVESSSKRAARASLPGSEAVADMSRRMRPRASLNSEGFSSIR